MNNIIQGAIFDIDGTLLDSMPVWTNSGEIYLASKGIKAEPNLGDTLFSMTVDIGSKYIKENYNLAEEPEEIARGINNIVADFYMEEPILKNGAIELLQTLQAAGVKMAVATSTDRPYIEAAFKKLGIGGYFQKIFTCTEVGATKSKPDIFYEAVNELGTPVEKTWVFEDGLYSIKTAKGEGFPIVGVYDEVSISDQEDIKRLSNLYLRELKEFDLI